MDGQAWFHAAYPLGTVTEESSVPSRRALGLTEAERKSGKVYGVLNLLLFVLTKNYSCEEHSNRIHLVLTACPVLHTVWSTQEIRR